MGAYMKKIVFLFLSFFVLCLCNCNAKDNQEVSNIQANSYIVIEKSTNKILQGYNYNECRSVASISKIMTAIIVIENINSLEKVVKVPEEINKVDGSSIYLKVNQEISVKDLLYGLLLRSGNDAAITLALATSNTLEDFVYLMNQKASYLKMNDSLFNNPTGLDTDDSGNLSSAYDMAILYSYCLENETFAEIIATKNYLNYQNKNKLLRNYQYCTGGKTGFTKKAKRTLITSGFKDNMNIIIVTLNCANDFEVHKNIYEYYFNNYQAIKVLNKGENIFDTTIINCKHDYYLLTNLTNLFLFYEIKSANRTINIKLFDENNKVVDNVIIYY